MISMQQAMTALGQDRVPYIASCLELARIHRLLILPRGNAQSCVSAPSRRAPTRLRARARGTRRSEYKAVAYVRSDVCTHALRQEWEHSSDRDHSLVAVVEDHAACIPGRVRNRVRERVPHTHVLPGGDAHELDRIVVSVHDSIRRSSLLNAMILSP
jgi:hypothetical protein